MIDTKAIIAERDRILEALDIDAAKTFIAAHGGTVPTRKLDWLRVLHLARFEATSIAADLRTDSQIYLAKTGAQSVAILPPTSPYSYAALALIFPPDVWAIEMGRAKGGAS